MGYFKWFKPNPRQNEIEEAIRKKDHASRAQREVIALARDLRAELERFVSERAKS